MARNNGGSSKGKVVGLKVTQSDPLDIDPSKLAVDLAQYLNSVSLFRQDAATFAERANIERRKASEMGDLIARVRRRRDKGPPENVSRMDPLGSYDPEALQTQQEQHERNAVVMDQKATEAAAKAEKAQREANDTQVLIHKVHQHRQKSAAEGKG